MDRDHRLEQELLVRASAPEELLQQVIARLDHYEVRHGNRGWERPIDELLVEMQEEAADIAGWGIGAAPQLDAGGLRRLLVAMSLGAAAWREIQELREELARGNPSAA